jgi:hypothetical protein
MIRKILHSALCLGLSPLLAAQQVAGPPQIHDPQKTQSALAPMKPVTLPKELEIPLVQLEDVSSTTAAVGQTVRMAVGKDVIVDGVVVIPKGTPARSVVRWVTRPIPGKRDGNLRIKPVTLTLPDNSRISLRDYDNSGDGVCYSRVSCGIVYVLVFPIIVSELIAIPFEKKHETGEDHVWPACSIVPAQSAKNVVVHPVAVASAQLSAGMADLNARCPVVNENLMNGQ